MVCSTIYSLSTPPHRHVREHGDVSHLEGMPQYGGVILRYVLRLACPAEASSAHFIHMGRFRLSCWSGPVLVSWIVVILSILGAMFLSIHTRRFRFVNSGRRQDSWINESCFSEILLCGVSGTFFFLVSQLFHCLCFSIHRLSQSVPEDCGSFWKVSSIYKSNLAFRLLLSLPCHGLFHAPFY